MKEGDMGDFLASKSFITMPIFILIPFGVALGTYNTFHPFNNVVVVFILASINALISSGQASYLNRLDDLFQKVENQSKFSDRKKFEKIAWVWTLLICAFFSLSLAALTSVIRIFLTFHYVTNGDVTCNKALTSLFSLIDTIIITTTGWGYLLLLIVAIKSWAFPTSLNEFKKDIDKLKEPQSDLLTNTIKSKYYQLLGMTILDLQQKGEATVSLDVDPNKHYHLYKQMHGGVTLSIADSAGGAALATLIDKTKRVATKKLSMKFIKPVLKGTIKANAHVREYKEDEQIGIVEVVVIDQDDIKVAMGEIVYAILDLNVS